MRIKISFILKQMQKMLYKTKSKVKIIYIKITYNLFILELIEKCTQFAE